jgi:uncharacterized protein YecE (DUF72 family)
MMPTDPSVLPEAPSLFVGTASLSGDVARYAARFNLLEVSAEPGRHPKQSGLTAMRRSVPHEFAFSVVPPAAVASLESGSSELIAEAESVANALSAKWWVLRTPPSVTPSARAARALEALVTKLKGGQRRVAWEPRGVWREEEALRTATSLGIDLVRDLLREDRLSDDPVVYTRIRALGEGAHVGAAAAERIAERLEGVTSAYVIVEGSGAMRVRQVLREMLGVAANADGADPEVDEEDSDEGLDDGIEAGDEPADDEEDS